MNGSSSVATNISIWRKSDFLLMAGISAGYLLLSYLLIGIRPEQFFLLGVINLLYFISKGTRKFIIGFSLFVVYWIIFDYMKAFPNYRYAPVSIESLYDLEKRIFGINVGGVMMTPNEYFLHCSKPFLDALAGSFYLTWIPVPLLFGCYLFYTNRPLFLRFAWSFFIVNMLGFVIYYACPAAPPWYVQEHGFVFDAHTPCGIGGLARFDSFFHVEIFKGLYSKSSNVFAAMPSLHCSYPTIVFYYSLKKKMGFRSVFFGIVMLGVWFAAIYTSHHYVLDVLAGISCAIAGIALCEWATGKGFLRPLFQRMLKQVS